MTASMNKPLKWATQRVNHVNKPTYRVQKKKTTNTAAKVKKELLHSDPKQEIRKLEKELAFTFDSIATITVHFESLHHAYTSSKPELEKLKTATRLCEMEKELLTAYDDLGLQVNHLERKITKLEKRITELKQQEESLFISSPCSTTTTDSSIYTQTPPNTSLTNTPMIDWSLTMIDDFSYPPCSYNQQDDFLVNQYYYDIMYQPMVFY